MLVYCNVCFVLFSASVCWSVLIRELRGVLHVDEIHVVDICKCISGVSVHCSAS